MQTINVTGEGHISYEILKDFHFTAQVNYENCISDSTPFEIPYLYKIDIEAEDEVQSKEIFISYLKGLNTLGIVYHVGHITYITKSIMDFEGSYNENDGALNAKLVERIKQLLTMLIIQKRGDYNKLQLELSHESTANSQNPDYLSIKEPRVIEKTVIAMIESLFSEIKQDRHLHSFEVAQALSSMAVPEEDGIRTLLGKIEIVKDKSFSGQLIYTVCDSLIKYMNAHTHLNPNNSLMTNDHARVLYATCRIHGLIKSNHEMELEGINYIRSLFTNKNRGNSMIGMIEGNV